MARPDGPLRLSHSQVGSLSCNLSWWISRRARMPQVSYWSTIAGSVMHERIEHFLLNDSWPEESVGDHVQRLVDAALEGTPYDESTGFRVSKQIPSGLKAADHPEGFNKAAVIAAIPIWADKWIAWMADRAEEGWTVWNGSTGVECEVNYELGGHPVIGSIDCVLVNESTGEIWLVDWKAGRSKPDDTSQLDGYRIGFEAEFGIRPTRAGFFMIRTGKEHLTANLPTFTKAMLDQKFAKAGERAAQAEAGHFDPDLSRCAYLCGVERWCPARHEEMRGVVLLPDPTFHH